MTMVVPFPAGSASDVVARILAPRLSELLKKEVLIENVSGAGGTTGALRVARAKPDGYQIAFGVTGSTPRTSCSTSGRPTMRRPTSPRSG